MEIKIIGKSVVPDRITLYENDLGAKCLVFTSNKVNDGVNLEVLNGYLEIEREEGVSDRFLLDKTLAEEVVYFTLPVNLALTETADILSSQIVFENDEKTLSYRSKVFYIDVKYSVEGVSSYEQIAPTVISQLESRMDTAVEDCESIKSEIEHINVDIVNNIEGISLRVKDEVLAQITEITVDDFLSATSENPVQNKVVKQALDGKVDKVQGKGLSSNDYTTDDKAKVDMLATTGNEKAFLNGRGNYVEVEIPEIEVDDILSTTSTNPIQNNVITEALNNKQNTLVSGANIKTINGNSVLGSGDLEVVSEVDSELSTESENPVQNKVVKQALDGKQETLVSGTNIKTINGISVLGSGDLEVVSEVDSELSTESENPVQNKVVTETLNNKQNTLIAGANIVIEDDVISATLPIIHNIRFKVGTYSGYLEVNNLKIENNSTTEITDILTLCEYEGTYPADVSIYDYGTEELLYSFDEILIRNEGLFTGKTNLDGSIVNGTTINNYQYVYTIAKYSHNLHIEIENELGNSDYKGYILKSTVNINLNYEDVNDKNFILPVVSPASFSFYNGNTLIATIDGHIGINATYISGYSENGKTVFMASTPSNFNASNSPNTDTVSENTLNISDNYYVKTEDTFNIDDELSATSENPVQNKVITEALEGKLDAPSSPPVINGTRSYAVCYGRSGGISTKTCAAIPSHVGNGALAEYQTHNTSNDIPSARLAAGTPLYDGEVANKKYVDDNKGTKLYKHTISITSSDTFDGYIIFYSLNKNNDLIYYSEDYMAINLVNVISTPVYVRPGGISILPEVANDDDANGNPMPIYVYNSKFDIVSVSEIVEEV